MDPASNRCRPYIGIRDGKIAVISNGG